MDNTICRTNEYFFNNCKIRFGRHDLVYDRENLVDYHITKWFVDNKISSEVEAIAMKEIIFSDPEYWASIPPYPNAIKVLEEINKKHQIFLASDALTVNNEACMIGKKRWLKRYTPFLNYSQLIYINNKSLLKADMIIEDVVHQVEKFEGIIILFDFCYNRDFKPTFRVHNWTEVENIFNENFWE